MGYKQLIEKSTRKAFTQLKDLAIDVTLQRKANQTFDFNTSDVSAITTTIVVKAVVVSTKKHKERDVALKEIMLRTEEVGDLTTIDSFLIGSEVWRISEVAKNDGYVSLLTISKEA
jgi:hypothetical protein